MFHIVKVPDPMLLAPSKSVGTIDKKVLEFIEVMKKALVGAKNPKGVGLAAPQSGKNLRIFLIRPSPKSPIAVFINPTLLKTSPEKTDGVPRPAAADKPSNKFEGCLSIPNVWGIVHRHQSVRLSYQTPDGKKHVRIFTDFPATIIQHEMDHIDGILFTQRVLEQKNNLFKITGKDKEGNDVFEEIEV